MVPVLLADAIRCRVGASLPQQVRAVARAHQQVVYASLLREAAATVQTLADDRTWVERRIATSLG